MRSQIRAMMVLVGVVATIAVAQAGASERGITAVPIAHEAEAVPLQGDACGDNRCAPPEDCNSCPRDCGSCCGDNRCAPPEDCNSCPRDCGGC